MASGSDIAAGAGGAAALIPALFGRGQSNYNAQDISHSGMYDPLAGQFGPRGALDYAQQRNRQADAVDARGAYTANYQQADQDRQRALEARANQSSVMNGLLARAAGQTPSIAQMQGDRQMGQVAAQQAALQASARGRGALANAATTAASNTANAQGAIAGQTQINAANERMQAERAAFDAASGMRQQDYGGQGQAAQQAQFQAGMQQTNRNANDARAMGYEQMGHQGFQAQQQGNVAMQQVAAQSHANAQNANARTEQQNAGSKGLIETVGDFFSDARAKMIYPMTSDFRAKMPAFGAVGGGGGPGGAIQAAAGPSDGATIGGGFHGGTGQLDSGGGMDVLAQTKWNNNELQGMAADPTGGMSGQMMLSDAKAKEEVAAKAYVAGQQAALQNVASAPAAQLAQGAATNLLMGPAGNAQKLANEAGWAVKREQGNVKPSDAATFKKAAAAVGKGLIGPVGAHFVAQAPASIPSDFSAKNVGLTRDAFGNPAAGDPAAPRMQYIPGQGWVDPSRQGPTLDQAMQQNDGPDFGNVAEQDARIAAMQRGDQENKAIFDKTRQEMAPSREEIAKDDAARRRMIAEAPDRAAIVAADEEARENGNVTPSEKVGKGKPSFLSAFGQASQGLNQAQFGDSFSSDFKSKRVVDLDDDVTMTDPKDEPAFQAWKKKYAHPQDDGEDYDLRGAWKAGLKPGPDGHWPDTFKRPNHPTFSSESKYANNEGAKPGRWDGDEFIPHRGTTPDGSAMRDGASDARTNNFDKSFHRNSRAEHIAEGKAYKRANEDKAARDADALMASFGKSLERPSAVASRLAPEQSPEAVAARTMKGFPYAYKPGLGPKDQAPGELNYGFMTQNLRQSPIAATAVKKNPETGLDEVDAHKMIKVMAATIADLQEQEDETRLMLAKGGRKK